MATRARAERAGLEELSHVLGLVYDTILDQARWNDALAAIGRFVDSSYTALVVEDELKPTASRFIITPDNGGLIRNYIDNFLPINPMRLGTVDRVVAGDVVITPDFMTRRQYRQTRFHREFLQPEGLTDVAASILEKTPERIAVLSILRGTASGPANENVRKRIALLTPHVRRAVEAGRTLDDIKEEAATMSDLLDRMAGAVLLLNVAGRVLHANQQAVAELDSGQAIRLSEGRAIPRDAPARTQLEVALAAAANGDAGPDDAPTTIILADRGPDASTGVLIPLASGARRRAVGRSQAVAALFVRHAKTQVPVAVGVLRALHGLTHREMTILVSMAESGGVAETAAVLGLSELTVRAHLRAIYRKTGATRHADLVRLVGALATPFG